MIVGLILVIYLVFYLVRKGFERYKSDHYDKYCHIDEYYRKDEYYKNKSSFSTQSKSHNTDSTKSKVINNRIYKNLTIAPVNGEGTIPWEKWVEFIESHSDYFSWLEDTDKGKEKLAKVANIPVFLREEALKRYQKKQAHGSYNKKRWYHEVILNYSVNCINMTIQKDLSKKELLLLLKMADFFKLSLLDNMSNSDVHAVTREEIESLELNDSKNNGIDISKASVIKELNRLSYFKYAQDVELAINETFKDYADDGRICFPITSLNRVFSIDAEFVFEGDGIKDQIKGMTELLNALGIKVVIEAYNEEFTSDMYIRRDIQINGKTYDALPATDWGDAFDSCVRLINTILIDYNKNERVYWLFPDETSSMILLTEAQFDYLDRLIPDDSDEKPLVFDKN